MISVDANRSDSFDDVANFEMLLFNVIVYNLKTVCFLFNFSFEKTTLKSKIVLLSNMYFQ